MEGVVVLVLVILVLAGIGFFSVLRMMFGAARSEPREVLVKPSLDALTRGEKLAVVWDVMGMRMPDDLREEMARLRGWRPAADAAPAVVLERALVVTPLPPVAATPVVTPPPIERDESLPVAPEVAAAAPHTPQWLRSFLSFENVIFLLAACLVLGGTMYVVATTWGHVPGRWRYLFLEGVVLFYGTALLGASALLDRRLGLTAAARFLATTAAITTVGAGVVACAAFEQSAAAGVLGAALAAAVATLDARAVLRLAGQRADRAPLFGLAVGLLAAATVGQPAVGALLILAAVVVGGPLFLFGVSVPAIPLLALAAALPAAAVMLTVGHWLPAPAVAPAIVAAGGGLAALGGAFSGPAAGLALVVLQAGGLGLAGGHLRPSFAALAVGLAVTAARRLRAGAAPDGAAKIERGVVDLLLAGQWIALAFLWARAAHLGGDALSWASNGATALPFALAPLAPSLFGPRARPASAAALVTAAAIVAGALAMALDAFPSLGVPSLATGAGAAALAYAWARTRDRSLGAAPWVVAHGLGLLAVWMGAHAAAPQLAMAAVATAALPLLLPRDAAHRVVGTIALPVALGLALSDGAPGAWLAALAAGYGALHLARPILFEGGDDWSTRPLGPLALVGAVALALLAPNGAHLSLVALASWPVVLVATVAAMVALVAWRGAPRFLAVEAMVGLAVSAVAGQAMPALALTCALLVGRAPGAIVAAAAALAPLAALAVGQHARPELVAAALAVGGVAVWRRALPGAGAAWIRWLGMPALIAAVLVLAFHHVAGAPSLLSPHLWPLVAAATLVPFALAVARDAAPAFVRDELLAGGALFAGAALLDAYASAAASGDARPAAGGALLALASGLVAADARGGLATRAAWIAALLLVPVAVVPMVPSPLDPRAALAAVAAVAVLGAVSKRLRARDVGAWALSAALFAVWWALAATAKHVSTGAPPEHLLPALGGVTALFGIGVALDARRLAEISDDVPRRLARLALLLAGAFTVAGAALIDAHGPRDAVLTLAALGLIGALSLVIAFGDRVGWPFFVAESVLGLGYAYLRLRTPWLDGFGDWDGVVVCVSGFACHAAERALRRAGQGLGADESRLMAVLFPLLSTFFLRPAEPFTGIGPALGAGFLAFLSLPSRAGARPLYAWLAGVLANLSLLALWAQLGVSSPVAYALPAGLTLALLCRAYGDQLGAAAPPLRTLASLLCFAATSWEMFRFQSVWPAAVLAATAVGAVLLGIHVRARAYLTIGFAALLLDIVANLTRWGMHDRLIGGALGVGGGVALFALGIIVSRHKELALARYRRVQAWPW